MNIDQARSAQTNLLKWASRPALSQKPWAKRPSHIRAALLSVFCSSMLLYGPLAAQEVDPNSLFGRDTIQSVFVRDSAVAVERFALAGRMEHLKEWDKAADVYQNIVKSYPDRVVPSQVNKDNKIYQYTSVIPAVQERLAKWPKEGLDTYRGRYEGEAAGLLESAHDDIAQLHRVFSFYFVTDSAKKASIHLLDLYMERGEFAAAAWLGDRLLNWHPGLKDDEPKILYRTAVAHQLAGNPEQAQLRLKQLREKFPQATSPVRGADVILAESLGQLLEAPESKLRESAANSWPMAFGSPDRARVPQFNSFGGARLFGVELPKGVVRTASASQRKSLEDANQRDIGLGLMTGVFPVVDRGELFFQDNARIYGLSLESGMPLPGWAETYDGERNGRYTLPNVLPFPRSQQCTVTVTDDSVLAIMGMPDLIAMQTLGGYGRRDTKLVSLDRKNGQQKWIADPKQFPEEAAALRNLDLAGSPLVVGDSVYVQARGGKGAQFEDSYVVCFEVASGKFKWACYIASANSTANFWDGSDTGAVFGQNVSHLAYSSGRLYALTNLGAVAAIDAYDGTVVWLDLYNRQQPENYMKGGFGRGFRVQRGIALSPTVKPWTSNPVMVSQGKVFILPSDGNDLYIYDAGTGKEIKRIPMRFYDSADTILGIVNEKLVLSSDRQVYCVDWQQFDEAAPKKDDFLIWKSPSFQRNGSVDDSIRGRGLVTADSVIIPTAWQIYRLSLKGGSVLESYPPGKTTTWGEDEGPGNVIMTQDRLIIAGPTLSGDMRISAYTDLTLAMQKLDAELAAGPTDPEPRLRYAEMLFVAGKPDLAIGKLDEAIAMVTSKANAAISAGATRERAFNTALGFAEKLAKENREGTLPVVIGLFDRAAITAGSVSQKVHYRLSRAAFASQLNRPEEEIKFYQQILLDPDLRVVPVASAEGDDVSPAADVARLGIDNVIARTARTFYAPHEKAAADLLAAGVAAGNAEQLQNVAMLYPNSTVAPKALMAAADLFESGNNPRAATQVLRLAYFRYPKNADTPRILETMARNYLRMPNRVDVAIARLRQGGENQLLSKPLLLPDGTIIQNVSFGVAINSLNKFSTQLAVTDLPDVKLPTRQPGAPLRKVDPFLPEPPQSIIPGVGALVTPVARFGRNDRVITFTAGSGIQVYAVGETKPSITNDAITIPPKGAAWLGANLLVWNQFELALIGTNGLATWKTSLKALPVLDVVAQNGGAKTEVTKAVDAIAQQQNPMIQINGAVIIGGQRINVRGGQFIQLPNGGVRAIGMPNGIPLDAAEQIRPAIEEIDKLHILSDRIIFSTTDGRIMALDLDGGKVLWQTRVNDRMPSNLLASDDFVVTNIRDNNGTSAQLTVLDTFTGQTLFRQPFGNDSGTPMIPVNLALAPDGMLVYLLPNSIEGKDLYNLEGTKPTYSVPGQGGELGLPFVGSTQPDHLQIFGNRIFAVATSASGSKVWMHDLRTGQPIKFKQSSFLVQMGPPSVQGRFAMRAVGPMVYVATSSEVIVIDLERQTTVPSPPFTNRFNLRDLIVTKSHLISFTEISVNRARTGNDPALPVQINAFSRVSTINGESGLYEHNIKLGGDIGVISYQPVEGGIYYLNQQHELHFLRGSRDP